MDGSEVALWAMNSSPRPLGFSHRTSCCFLSDTDWNSEWVRKSLFPLSASSYDYKITAEGNIKMVLTGAPVEPVPFTSEPPISLKGVLRSISKKDITAKITYCTFNWRWIRLYIVVGNFLQIYNTERQTLLSFIESGECWELPVQTPFDRLFSLYLCRYIPPQSELLSPPCKYMSPEIEWHRLLLRGFDFVRPGRWTVALIYSDAATPVDLQIIQAKQTEEARQIFLLTLPSLWRSSTPSGVPRW